MNPYINENDNFNNNISQINENNIINNNIPQIDENNINITQLDEINNNVPQNNRMNPTIIGIIIFFVILISFYNIYSFFHIVNSIKKAYLMLPFKVFEECYLYQEYLNLFIDFISCFLGIDLIILISIPIYDNNFNLEIILEKYFDSFLYFNYLVFGPFLFGCLFLGLKHCKKFFYFCANNDPEQKRFNFRLVFLIILGLIISASITFLGSLVLETNYFRNSIKCKSTGNYIIGTIFWLIALRRSQLFRNEQDINNPNLNEGILDNEENNKGEKDN